MISKTDKISIMIFKFKIFSQDIIKIFYNPGGQNFLFLFLFDINSGQIDKFLLQLKLLFLLDGLNNSFLFFLTKNEKKTY